MSDIMEQITAAEVACRMIGHVDNCEWVTEEGVVYLICSRCAEDLDCYHNRFQRMMTRANQASQTFPELRLEMDAPEPSRSILTNPFVLISSLLIEITVIVRWISMNWN